MSTDLDQRVFAELADGEYHSGAALAERQGVTRGGIWKAVESLRRAGLPIDAVTNRGYRLAMRTAPLSVAHILEALPAEVRSRLASCEVLWSVESTNRLLLESLTSRPGALRVLLTENQTAGRGRRGRSWLAPLGGGICLSIGFAVDELPPDFAALTLAIGLAVRAALAAAGAQGIAVKWPNDLVAGPYKLGGILTELRAEAGGPAWVVIGLGLNFALPAEVREELRRSGAHATDLQSLGLHDDRNRLVARIIEHGVGAIDEFLAHGLAPFMDRWRAHDALFGREVVVSGAGARQQGRALGIDQTGALRLSTGDAETTIVAGDVSVRAGLQPDPS
jgi:BirA family biotin operon repressor/biotin-[acetyl-CoA-carboxylase] ligase